MAETIFDNIDPDVLERVQSLRLIDDELMTLVFSGDKKSTEFIIRILLNRNDLRVKKSMTQVQKNNLFGRSVKLSFVSDFVHNRPQKIKAFFLNKFEFVMRQMLSYGGMYFLRMTGFSISKSILSEIFSRSGIISSARSLSSCMA